MAWGKMSQKDQKVNGIDQVVNGIDQLVSDHFLDQKIAQFCQIRTHRIGPIGLNRKQNWIESKP